MKDYNIFIRDLQNKVDEVANRYYSLRNELGAMDDPDSRKEIEHALVELEELNRQIRQQFEQARKEEQNERKLSEIEKNIYNSIRSFERAYTKAGSIFHTH
jgi:DNA replication initiation complex subunit (GINS family)